MSNWLDYLFGARPIEEEEADEGMSAVPPSGHENTPERLDDEVHGFHERFGEDAQTEIIDRGADDEDYEHPTDTDEQQEDEAEKEEEQYSPYELEPTEEDEDDQSEY